MGTVTDLRPKSPGPVKLQPGAGLAVAQAAAFAGDLDSRIRGADLPRAMYLLGQAENHLARLIEIVLAVTGTPAP